MTKSSGSGETTTVPKSKSVVKACDDKGLCFCDKPVTIRDKRYLLSEKSLFKLMCIIMSRKKRHVTKEDIDRLKIGAERAPKNRRYVHVKCFKDLTAKEV